MYHQGIRKLGLDVRTQTGLFVCALPGTDSIPLGLLTTITLASAKARAMETTP